MPRHGSIANGAQEQRKPANDNFSVGAGNLKWITPAIPDMNHQEVDTQAAPLTALGKQIYEAEGFISKSSAEFYSIYVVADIYGEFSKIGVANTPTKRLAQLQTGNPSRLFIHRLFWIHSRRRKVADVAMAIEAAAHASAERSHYRGVGEWFRCSPSDACDVVQSEVDMFVEHGEVYRYSLMTPPYDLWRA